MKFRGLVSAAMSVGFALSMAVSSQVNAVPVTAGSLGLISGEPDIQSNFLNFEYTGAGDAFTIESAFLGGGQFTNGGFSENIIDSSFLISGTANASDAALNLTISGELASLGGGLQTLLAGDLIGMANSGTGVMEFLFGNLTGALSSFYGSQAGVIFTDGALAGFNFSQDTSLTGFSGMSDTISVNVPLPGSLALSILGISMLTVSRRRKLDASVRH
ncbi:MAG: hypothetical protein H7A01_07270 [Hahellaceae bacterium]|nr:hypothetical protein [Hahellaceae bacterium]